MNGYRLFVRQDGAGRPVPLLHGFPTSSHDWALTVPALVAAGCRVTTLDMLGFGQSDKPRRHRYSLHGQADLVEALWKSLGIGKTMLVAHDYGASVAQELLARDPGRITRTALLNGGLYADLHRPVLLQRLLHSRIGPLLARLTDEKRFVAGLRGVLSRPVPDEVLQEGEQEALRVGGLDPQHRVDARAQFAELRLVGYERRDGRLPGRRDAERGEDGGEGVRMPGKELG